MEECAALGLNGVDESQRRGLVPARGAGADGKPREVRLGRALAAKSDDNVLGIEKAGVMIIAVDDRQTPIGKWEFWPEDGGHVPALCEKSSGKFPVT